MACVLSEYIFLFSLNLLNSNPIILYPIVTKWGGSEEVNLENSEIQTQQFMPGFSGNSNPSIGVQHNISFSRTSAINSSKPRWLRYCCARAVSSWLRALWASKGLRFKYLSSWVSRGTYVTTRSPVRVPILSGSTNLENKHRSSCWDS